MKGMFKMRKIVNFNHKILNAEHGWNVSDDPLDTMFINDLGEMVTGEWNEFHERCSEHSEYYQDATRNPNIEYIEPIVFEPESNTMILPDRVFNCEERKAMLRIAQAIDDSSPFIYFEGDNEYVGALNALSEAGAGAEAPLSLFTAGDIVFIDDDEYDELDDCEKEDVLWTNEGEMFVLSE